MKDRALMVTNEKEGLEVLAKLAKYGIKWRSGVKPLRYKPWIEDGETDFPFALALEYHRGYCKLFFIPDEAIKNNRYGERDMIVGTKEEFLGELLIKEKLKEFLL